MSPDTFDRQIEAALQRLEELAQSAKDSADPRALVVETLEELSTALEELHVAAPIEPAGSRAVRSTLETRLQGHAHCLARRFRWVSAI